MLFRIQITALLPAMTATCCILTTADLTATIQYLHRALRCLTHFRCNGVNIKNSAARLLGYFCADFFAIFGGLFLLGILNLVRSQTD